jgi:nucleoid-associated protein YgaU
MPRETEGHDMRKTVATLAFATIAVGATANAQNKQPYHVWKVNHGWTSSRNAQPVHVNVAKGDPLWRLAAVWQGNGRAWRTIAKLNHLAGSTMYVGQRIRVR